MIKLKSDDTLNYTYIRKSHGQKKFLPFINLADLFEKQDLSFKNINFREM